MSLSLSEQLQQRVRFVAAQRAGKARERLERDLKRAAPVAQPRPFQVHEPGMLRDSISVSVRFDQVQFTFTAMATAPHASFTNTGTNAFTYLVNRPVSASGRRGAVRFFWARTGNIEFRPTGWLIQNPGISAQRWWDNTLARWHDILEASA
jgi:hypothetical protein